MRTVRSLNWRGLAEAQRGLLTRYASTDISKYISHIVFSVVLGVFAGAGAILFHTMLEGTRHFFEFFNLRTYLGVDFNLIFIFPVAGAVVVAAMTRYLPSIARERDVDERHQVRALSQRHHPFQGNALSLFRADHLDRFRRAVGPEGPPPRWGAAWVAHGEIFRLNRGSAEVRRGGRGAAIAAVFNAPFAGLFRHRGPFFLTT